MWDSPPAPWHHQGTWSLGTEKVQGGAGSTWVLPRENPRPDTTDSAFHLMQLEWLLLSSPLPTPLHRGPHSKLRKLPECLAELPVQQGLQDVLIDWVWGKSVTDSSQVSGLISWVHGDAIYWDVPNRRECKLGARSWLLSVQASCGCCNSLPAAGWLKAAAVYSLMVLSASSSLFSLGQNHSVGRAVHP